MKKTVQRRFYLILCVPVFLISGCTLDFSLPSNEKMHLSVYQAGRPAIDQDVTAADPAVQAVQRWLAANPEGWDYAYTTRAPGIYLKGENFSVNILKNEVSVKYCRAFYNCHFWVKAKDDLFGEVQKITLGR